MNSRIELKGIETNKELIVKDCPDFDFVEFGIGIEPYQMHCLNLTISQVKDLNLKLDRIIFEKMQKKE